MEHSISILIVEDEALIAENLKLTLEDFGYDVAGVCYSFAEAAAALPAAGADLVMLDINLGSRKDGETGLQLAALVPPGKPFIFLTAYSDVDTIRHATRLKPAGYLIKPVNPASIFAAVQTAIESASHPASEPQPPAAGAFKATEYFFVKMGTRTHKLRWAEVASLEAGKNYVRIRPQGVPLDYPLRGSLAFVLGELVPEQLQADFIRLSRSVCVNRRFITAIGADWVECDGARFENTRLSAKELAGLLGE